MDPNKPFALFANFTYYPHGGMWDYRGDFATVDEASAFAVSKEREELDIREPWDWFHVVDLRTMRVVLAKGHSCYGDPEDFKKKDLT